MGKINTETTECVHHFILPPPNGRESLGTCKKCGVERMHYNSFENKSNWRKVLPDQTPGKGHGLTKAQLEKEMKKRNIEPVKPGSFK